MGLAERFSEAGVAPGSTKTDRPKESSSAAPPVAVKKNDPLTDLKQRAENNLYARLGNRLYDSDMSRDELHDFVARELEEIMAAEAAPLTDAERLQVVGAVRDDILGFGPMEEFLQDPSVTEIMVNGEDAIYVERGGQLELTEARFLSNDHLRRVIERIVAEVGRRIDESSPMVDARLLDGSRVNAIIPPLAVKGPALTIRKFSNKSLTIDDLIRWGSLTEQTAGLLEACVLGALNIFVSGGTGTGKTTLLNLLSGFIPDTERIVTIEDAVELQLRQRHVISLEARPANSEGKGAIHIRDLVKNSLRMRPDRIVIGECRGGEALDMLQAMNTGHDGSLTTGHSNSPRDMLSRLETMVLMAELDLPVRAIRDQIAGALDLIVQLTRLPDGRRCVTYVTEVVGMEGDVITLSDLFVFDYDLPAPDGRMGRLVATGVRPTFDTKLANHGVTLDAELFNPFSNPEPSTGFGSIPPPPKATDKTRR